MIREWLAAGIFSAAEVHGAEVLCRADTSGDELVPVAAALALWAPLHGHACVDLAEVAAMVLSELAVRRDLSGVETTSGEVLDAAHLGIHWPTAAQWEQAVQHSTVCRTVAAATLAGEPVLDDRPLVLHGRLLYTQRQWVDECTVANDLRRRSLAADLPVHPSTRGLLEQLLPPDHSANEHGPAVPNRQHEAAMAAVASRLSVIVGGPGTGKTHTIARLLTALQHQATTDGAPLRIALAAPTGKAAARMAEALAAAGVTGSLAELQPTTIHRLLGVRGQRTRFVHGTDRPLDVDVVVVDEASMVALPLMARLVEAIRDDARLVLVGDPDQLESIEVGSVLADIVSAAATPGSPLAARVTRLDRPRRQAAGSPIGALADAIRLDRADDAIRLLRTTDPAQITFVDTAPLGLAGAERVIREALIGPLHAAVAAAEAGDAAAALAHFAGVRLLCAHRTGTYGVQRWNRIIETWLHGETTGSRLAREHVGRPLLVTRNDPRLRIANGDTGIIVADPAGPRAAFSAAAGVRLLAPAQLDAVETAYAMTVHKSQGSEYATVVVMLPPASSPLVGRELLYTAITRATQRLVVVGDDAAVRACVHTPGRRITGLASALGLSVG